MDTGILGHLRAALGDRLVPVLLCDDASVAHWSRELGPRVIRRSQLGLARTGRASTALGSFDAALERVIGYYSLSLRFNRRHGFLRDRMTAGHPMPYLNTSLLGPLPEWPIVERIAYAYAFGRLRYLPRSLRRRFRDECAALVLATASGAIVQPFTIAARRYRRPVVGYVASWDHTVGKGVISPYLDRYLVQNGAMARDLTAYHGVDEARISVTGWPQTDVFSVHRSRAAYRALLESYHLDPRLPTVLYAGNTPANHPTEGALVRRLAERLESLSFPGVNLIVRPHPNDSTYIARFGEVGARTGVRVQEPRYEDFDVLATLLQHVDCVVANAGTILLDAIINDRPAVCVLYDEGETTGQSAAEKSIGGSHYQALAESAAFFQARSLEEAVAGIVSALAQPEEHAAERARVSRDVVGEIDGRASERVARAILDGIGWHP